MPTSERWEAIHGADGYEVSSEGRVRSVDRINVNRNGVSRVLKGRVLRPTPNRGGYLDVRLGAARREMVHRLVADAFCDRPPDTVVEVRHLDGDKLNNRAINLAWGSRMENMQDQLRHGTHPRLRLSERTRCPYGHVLSGNNLQQSPSVGHHRHCLACCRARSYLYYHYGKVGKSPTREVFQAVSDRYYDAILRRTAA